MLDDDRITTSSAVNRIFVHNPGVIASVGLAPCQCFSPAGIQMTSPGRISSIGPPQRCTPADTIGDDQGLPERMRMPCGSGAGLKRDGRTARTCRACPIEQRVDTNRAGEIFGWPRSGWLGATSLDLHD